MAMSRDLHPPLAIALLDRRHGIRLQTSRLTPQLARPQSGYNQPKNVRRRAESLANIRA
jgi:hypothetical protein